MPSLSSPLGAFFGRHDYEIVFPLLGRINEAHILATDAAPLRVGDRYTIGRHGCLYDLVVEDISRLTGGRWSARCAVADRQWI